jgi:hypothetical protein
MEYDVIIAASLKGLIKAVNKKLNEGYKPQGGVFKVWGWHYQAIIKEVKV